MEYSLTTEERTRRSALKSAVTALFRSQPREWISARDFEKPGGRQGWRTRISEARQYVFEPEGGTILNKQTRTRMADGGVFVESFYMYLPQRPLGRDASELTQATLFTTPDRPFAR